MYTLEIAEKHLNAWLEAELAITTGAQSYSVGSRTVTRADLGQVRQQIKFWSNEIYKLKNISQRKGRNRVLRVVPRDL
ncbi:DUF6148 family protein [Hathewaya massiliensis]|uniref:DUF6148 family protein n=1 Tax=Hathewaya massiliensis TaxID=1964382 RepID=UPI001157676D|nr:DUF6148 family protein [Hathewaya massiliensis]